MKKKEGTQTHIASAAQNKIEIDGQTQRTTKQKLKENTENEETNKENTGHVLSVKGSKRESNCQRSTILFKEKKNLFYFKKRFFFPFIIYL